MPESARPFTFYASAYDRMYCDNVRMRPQSRRTLEFNFNGVLSADEEITHAQADLAFPFWVQMSDLTIATNQRSVDLTLSAQWPGESWLRIQATTDAGQTYSQLVRVGVFGPGPIFGDTPQISGPNQLIANAP